MSYDYVHYLVSGQLLGLGSFVRVGLGSGSWPGLGPKMSV